jgi:hypothetical protein
MKRFGMVLATLLIASLFGSTTTRAVFAAPTDTRTVTFDTAITPQYYGAGAYAGVLHLTFEAGGIVNGWYRPADVGQPRNVIGGLDGDKLWLDLGEAGLHDIQTTYENGKIVGATYLVNQPYSFVATPTTKQP